MEVSGVASFSPYRSLRCTHDTGRSSPASARRSLANRETGWNGSSLISEWATMGSHSSSRPTRDRMIRVLAWPRSPSRITSCPASTAFSSWGRTVSSKPSTPVTRGSPAAMRARGVAPDLLGHRDRRPAGLPEPAEGGDVGGRGRPDREVEAGRAGVRVVGRFRRGHGPSLRGTILPWCAARAPVGTPPGAPGARSAACPLVGEPWASGRPRPAPRAPDGPRWAEVSQGGPRDGKMKVRQRSGPLGLRAIVAGKRPDQGEKT